MKKKTLRIMDIIPVIILIIIFFAFVILSGGKTLTVNNMLNIVIQVMPVAIGTLGVIFVVAMGSTDISIGGNAALSLLLTTLGYAIAMAWAVRTLKGVSGDLAGYALCVGELCGLAALAVF